MRKSVRVSAPLFVITTYYILGVAAFFFVLRTFPALAPYMPVGGLEDLASQGSNTFEALLAPVQNREQVYASQLAIAIFATAGLMAPVSWVYFITTPRKRVDRSFAQTMIILPIIVAGIAMIVQNSLALAFSLAGIVAAVRFRFSLSEPAHTLYVFCSIAVGLAAGISAIGIALVISVGFVYSTLGLWILDYGARLNGPFFAFLTSRDQHEDDDF